MSIERYDCNTEMYHSHHGAFVRHDDHLAALTAERERADTLQEILTLREGQFAELARREANEHELLCAITEAIDGHPQISECLDKCDCLQCELHRLTVIFHMQNMQKNDPSTEAQ